MKRHLFSSALITLLACSTALPAHAAALSAKTSIDLIPTHRYKPQVTQSLLMLVDYDDTRALQKPIALGDAAEAPTAPLTSVRPKAAGTPERPRVKLSTLDYADAGSTALGLSRGFVEANPLFAWAGNAAPIVGLVGKYGMKHALVGAGASVEQANRSVSIGSALGACNNIAGLAGATVPTALVVGVTCAGIYAYTTRQPKQPREVLVVVE